MKMPWRSLVVGAAVLCLTVTIGDRVGKAANEKDVNVVNTPNVNVVNTPASPALVRDVDAASREPFNAFVNMHWAAGETQAEGPGGFGLIQVPAGKRLVIQYASGGYEVPTGQQVQVELNTAVGPLSVFNRVLSHSQGTWGGLDLFFVAQDVTIYAEGEVHVYAFRNSGTGSGQGQFVVEGYLTDL
jgi:hypothetical protein